MTGVLVGKLKKKNILKGTRISFGGRSSNEFLPQKLEVPEFNNNKFIEYYHFYTWCYRYELRIVKKEIQKKIIEWYN